MVGQLIMIRHGESVWNAENRFTGWTDVELTAKGEQEVHAGAKEMKDAGLKFDVCYTSLLKRANRTLHIVLEDTDQCHLPITKSWRLNERHYGALQGLNKSETAAKHGEEQVLIWRRSYNVAPPSLEKSDPRFSGNDPKYAGLPKDILPVAETLADTVARVLPFWHDHIAPQLLAGKNVLIAAHGNSMRALIKHLDHMTEKDILALDIPTGSPLVYTLDESLAPKEHHYLCSPEELEKRVAAVKAQGLAYLKK